MGQLVGTAGGTAMLLVQMCRVRLRRIIAEARQLGQAEREREARAALAETDGTVAAVERLIAVERGTHGLADAQGKAE